MCLSDPQTAPPPRGVLITRPEPAASATAALLSARGYQVHLAPMLAIAPVLGLAVRKVQAILVTSANALAALAAYDRATRLLTVGDATAAQAQAMGFDDVRSAGRDAVALARMAGAQLDPTGGTVLLVSGNGQGLPLMQELRAQGFRVIRRIAYRRVAAHTLPVAALAALQAGRIGTALFYSADTARAFLRCAADHKAALADIEALAISPQTAQALRSVAWRGLRVAAHPNQDELVALLP